MEQLLASYLYQYKICPLPNVGTLLLQPGGAAAQQADKLMQAPVPSIEFSAKETNAEGLLQYVSTILKIDRAAASLTLDNFCKKLLQLNNSSQINFANAGAFKADDNGQLYFETANPGTAYLQDVPAERVIHPDAKHNMLVGDTHTNTSAMTEMLFAEEKPRRSSWVWWAIGLAVLAAIAIAFYFASYSSGEFGNANKVSHIQAPSSTYSTGSK